MDRASISCLVHLVSSFQLPVYSDNQEAFPLLEEILSIQARISSGVLFILRARRSNSSFSFPTTYSRSESLISISASLIFSRTSGQGAIKLSAVFVAISDQFGKMKKSS